MNYPRCGPTPWRWTPILAAIDIYTSSRAQASLIVFHQSLPGAREIRQAVVRQSSSCMFDMLSAILKYHHCDPMPWRWTPILAAIDIFTSRRAQATLSVFCQSLPGTREIRQRAHRDEKSVRGPRPSPPSYRVSSLLVQLIGTPVSCVAMCTQSLIFHSH